MNQDGEPVNANNIDLRNVEKMIFQYICDMLKKHESISKGQIGHTDVTEYAIDHKDIGRQFKLAPYSLD